MIRIRVLGRLSVERTDDAVGPAAEQRKPLALLVVLGMSGRRGITRDELLDLLWPNADPDSGRKSLKQTVYSLRRDLGTDRVILASDADQRLTINDDVVSIDAWDFERAVESDNLDLAAELYGGSFLDGFSIRGSAEFDHWIDAERSRLTNMYAGVLERLAARAESSEDHVGASAWWRRLAKLKPLDSRIASRFITSLAASGDRASALVHARIHQSLLREELGAAPDPAVAALEERLRNGNAGVSRVVSPSIESTEEAPPDAASGGLQPDATVDTRVERRPRVGRTLAIAGVVLAIGLAALILVRRNPTSNMKPNPRADLVLVAPFRVEASDSSLRYLRDGMAELLSATLTGEGGLRAVDTREAAAAWRTIAGQAGPNHELSRADAIEVARSLGAGRLLQGAVIGGPARRVVQAQLVTVPGGQVTAEASAAGPPDSLLSLVERVTAQLLSGNAEGVERHLASALSPSLSAVRAYIDGRAAYRNGRYAEATRHFQRAVAIDSTFAAAGVGLAMTAGFVSEVDARGLGLRIAWTNRDRLGSRDRAYLDAALGPRYPGPSSFFESIQAEERALQAYPLLAELWYELGDGFFHQGAMHDVPDAMARAAAAFERALSIDSAYVAPLGHLVEMAAAKGDTARVRQLAARYFALDSLGDVASYLRWRVALALGDEDGLAQVRRMLPTQSEGVLQRLRGAALLDGVGLDDADRAAALLRARSMASVEGWRLHVDLFAYELNRGRPAAAAQALSRGERSGALTRHQALTQQILAALHWGGDRRSAVAAARELRPLVTQTLATKQHPSGANAEAACAVGLWAAEQKDPAGAREALAVLREIGRAGAAAWLTEPVNPVATAHQCVLLLEAIAAVAAREDNALGAVRHLDSLTVYGNATGLTSALSDARNLVVARLYDRLGDTKRGLVAARRAPYFWGATSYLPTYLLTRARLAARAGERDEAIRAYRHFLALRSAPEPAMLAQTDSARLELARLDAGNGTRATHETGDRVRRPTTEDRPADDRVRRPTTEDRAPLQQIALVVRSRG